MLAFVARYMLFIVLFCISLAYGLIAYLPLSLVVHELQKNVAGLTIGASKGSWWQGQLNDISWQQFNHAKVAWDLNLSVLLSSQIAAKISLDHSVVKASIELSLPISNLFSLGLVQLNTTKVQVAIDQLTPFAPYPLPKIAGQLTVNIDQLTLDTQALSTTKTQLPLVVLDTPIHFSTSPIVLLDNLAIGRYSGQITNTSSSLGYRIEVQSLDDVLQVSGHSLLSAHEVRSQYLVQPNPNTHPSLTKLLDMMGQKLQNGDYRFNTVYAL